MKAFSIFKQKDYVRVCHGKIMENMINTLHERCFCPKSTSIDWTIGLFGHVIGIENVKREALSSVSSNSDFSNKIFITVELDIHEESEILSVFPNKKVVFDMNSLVNYTLLGYEKADLVYEESADKDLAMFHTFIDPDVVPEYLYNELESSDVISLRTKYNMACLSFYSFYMELFTEMTELNKLYRFKVHKQIYNN